MNDWQCRAARLYLKLTRKELGQKAGLSEPTIVNIELGKESVASSTVEKAEKYFLSQGIKFDSGDEYFCIQVPAPK